VSEFSALLKNNKIRIISFTSLFFLISHTNALGLLAYSFTSTRHLAITLSLALPFWLGFIIFSIRNNTLNFLAHLVPLGTPAALIPFIVIIELIRNIIRPITLSVRLAANIIAGHLLLTLLRELLPSRTFLIFRFAFAAQSLLIVLEAAVAIIQAYVFSILTTLYASEA
jgi:F-type H+-transporting ATPase subunit a